MLFLGHPNKQVSSKKENRIEGLKIIEIVMNRAEYRGDKAHLHLRLGGVQLDDGHPRPHLGHPAEADLHI